jgi:hypothetical protein
VKSETKEVCLASKRVVTLRDAEGALGAGATRVLIAENCVMTRFSATTRH